MKKNVKSNISGGGGKILNTGNYNNSLSARGGTSFIGRGINAAATANKK